MGQTVEQKSFYTQLQAIYRRLNVLEYQQKKVYGNIVIDGNLGFQSILGDAIVLNGATGQISVYNGAILIDGTNGKITLTNGTTTMLLDSVAGTITASTATGSIMIDGNNGNIIGNSTADVWSNIFTLRKNNTRVAAISYRSRLVVATRENAIESFVISGSETDRVSYNQMTIYDKDIVREAFFLIDAGYLSGVFGSSMQFTVMANPSTFEVRADDTSGNGYMKIPNRASDPSNIAGRMYYNTTLNRFRVYDGTGWKSL